MPAVRAAAPSDVVLADGFSCRTQIEQSDNGGHRAVHLAQLLQLALQGERGAARAEAELNTVR
jgi:hypothetical protein